MPPITLAAPGRGAGISVMVAVVLVAQEEVESLQKQGANSF